MMRLEKAQTLLCIRYAYKELYFKTHLFFLINQTQDRDNRLQNRAITFSYSEKIAIENRFKVSSNFQVEARALKFYIFYISIVLLK